MTCPNGGTLSGGSCVVSTIACAEPVVVSCPPGTTYTGGRCIADPTCPDGMPLDETVDGCLKLMTCPHGPGFQCMQNPDLIKPDGKGGWQCSPYTCVNAAAGEGVVLDEMSEDYLKDDGQRDEEGHCLGQMYVFNGKPSRCRPKGWTVGFIADCCKNGDLLPEDTGMGALAMTGVLWDAAQGAYAAADTFGTLSTFVNNYGDAEQFGAAVQLVEAAAGASPATQAGVEAAADIFVRGGSQSSAMMSGALDAAGPKIAIYAAGAVTDALGGGQDVKLLAQMAMTYVMMSGPQMVIGMVGLVVTRFLMGTGCDIKDITTASEVKSDRCHYIGKYCEKRILGICVQKAKGHCCFGSMLARIIHEQAAQLASFQGENAWGTAKHPYCRGFTPEEFQSIDFSKVDLTEYYGTVLKDIDEKIQGAAANVSNSIANKFQQIQSSH